MDTLLLTDDRMLAHEPGQWHPESPSRLAAILRRLDERAVPHVKLASPPRATEAELSRVHSAEHVRALLALAGRSEEIDPDTTVSAGSIEAALLAAGAAAESVRAVLDGRANGAFALVRPPGHHAERGRAMGFCLFNNIAVAAAEAHAKGLERVLCVDWDVHHGNGTQRSFWRSKDLLFLSTHQWPLYPGTGHESEVGEGEGAGYTVNVPLPSGCGDRDYAAVFRDLLLPLAETYRPELVLVSAGFDAHRDDPLGGMGLTADGFAALCGVVKDIADRHCPGKLVLTLEGGYDLQGLSDSVRCCVEVLASGGAPRLQPDASAAARDAIARAKAAQATHWKF
jgi:acetoin utilization deacetylase AcuC-like enzyme